MKKTADFKPLVQTNIPDWLRELWEVEAMHPPMVGSHLKWGPHLPATKTRRRTSKAKELSPAVKQ